MGKKQSKQYKKEKAEAIASDKVKLPVFEFDEVAP